MKPLLILTITALTLISSCASPENKSPANPAVACGADEVLVDGNCVPKTETTNSSLFDQDLDSFVVATIVNSGALKGYLAEPSTPGNYPWVVMIHEWWGLNEHVQYMARLLAKSGYRVFAIDLYDGVVATGSSQAGQLAGAVRNNPAEANAKMQLALASLKSTQPQSKIGTIGWCFGGQQSLNVSLETPVDATVVYYGNLSEDMTQLAQLKGPVLGIFGDKDNSIPLEKIELFKNNLLSLNKPNTIHIYPGLGHAFANPSGGNYASGATIDAWNKTLDFLNTHLK